MSLGMVLVILLILLVLGGVTAHHQGRISSAGGPAMGLGGLILVVLLVLWLLGKL